MLRAIASTMTGGDAEAMNELGEKARAVMKTKKPEAHRQLHRHVASAIEIIAEDIRDGGEKKRTAAQRAMLRVLAVLAQHPDAFPTRSTELDDTSDRARRARVRSALRECAMNWEPNLADGAEGDHDRFLANAIGRVLRGWGCPGETIEAAHTNVRRGRSRGADRKK